MEFETPETIQNQSPVHIQPLFTLNLSLGEIGFDLGLGFVGVLFWLFFFSFSFFLA